MRIYIPTYRRVSRQFTYDKMPPVLQQRTTLVVAADEADAHRKLGRQILVSPAQGQGMAAIRGWIVRHAQRQGECYIAILDDDLTLQIRKGGRIVNSTDGEQAAAFQWMEDQMVRHEVAACAFGVRFLNYADETPYEDCMRMMQAIGLNVRVLQKLGVNFDNGVPPWFPMDDFNLTLELLTLGVPNRVSFKYRANPASANAPGGCSEQRTLERQNEAAHILKMRFPKYVRVREKKAWRGMEGKMYDVAVQWKLAYKEAEDARARTADGQR